MHESLSCLYTRIYLVSDCKWVIWPNVDWEITFINANRSWMLSRTALHECSRHQKGFRKLFCVTHVLLFLSKVDNRKQIREQKHQVKEHRGGHTWWCVVNRHSKGYPSGVQGHRRRQPLRCAQLGNRDTPTAFIKGCAFRSRMGPRPTSDLASAARKQMGLGLGPVSEALSVIMTTENPSDFHCEGGLSVLWSPRSKVWWRLYVCI